MTTPKVHRPSGAAGGDELIVESGGIVTIKSGGKVKDQQAQGGSQPALVFHHDVVIAHSSLATVNTDLTVADKIQIVDTSVLKTVAGGSASTGTPTITLKTSTGGAISDAIGGIKVVDQTITRAAKINDAFHTIAAGGIVRIVKNGAGLAAGASVSKSHDCIVRITAVKRS
jgi:hypothetical protein